MSKYLDGDIELNCNVFIEMQKRSEDKDEAVANLKELIIELEEEDKNATYRLQKIRKTLIKAKKAYYEIKENSTLL